MYQVYQLYFDNGTHYIGSTNNLKNRIRQHRHSCLSDKPRNSRLSRTWKKYGEPFIQVLGTYDSELSMIKNEQYWLDTCWGQENFLNLNSNADRGPDNKGKKKPPRSAEHTLNLRKARGMKVVAISPEGIQTKYFSCVHAAEELGFNSTAISTSIKRGKVCIRGRYKGWTFRRANK